MNKIAIVVHGGAGPDSDFIKQNVDGYKKGLEEAVAAGYKVLEGGGTATDAVEAAVNYLEDNPLFNAGRGSALTEKADVEMDASIMDGKSLQAGAVTVVKNVKNPISLAKVVLKNTKHIYIAGPGAIEFAEKNDLEFRPDSYFTTDHAYQEYEKSVENEKAIAEAGALQVNRRKHGTVGAVALDKDGNLAAATSTGGLENKITGRVADSSMIGIGTYANNNTCAVSGTGDGEYLMQNVVAFHVAALMEYKGFSLKEACKYLIHEKLKDVQGDMGIIAIDPQGNIAFEWNSERMHRGWRTSDGEQGTGIY